MHSHPLIKRLNDFHRLPDELVPELLNAFKVVELSRENTFLREGFANRNVYFLHSGVVRRYYISQLGHQKTTAFIVENSFFTDLESFERRRASTTTFTTETSCTVYSVDYFKLHGLMGTYAAIREAFTKMKNHYSALAEARKHFLANEPIENRVRMLVEELPEVMKCCRKKDIISYLRTNSQTYNFVLKHLPPTRN